MTTNGKKKVLILDDEPHVVTYLATLLQDNGYETVDARNGKEGMEKAKADKPDLVCLDITMPEKSGVAVYRMLREEGRLRSVPVIRVHCFIVVVVSESKEFLCALGIFRGAMQIPIDVS